MRNQKLLPYTFLAPALLAMVFLVFYPLASGIALSFTNATERNVAKWIGDKYVPAKYEFNGTQNFTDVLNEQYDPFWRTLAHTVLWTITNVTLHVAIGILLATLLNRKIRGRTIYRVLLIVPWAVPSFVSAFSWRYIFNQQYGFVNLLLGKFGVETIPWFSNYYLATFTAIVANTWLAIPFNVVTILGGLQSIPADLYEAGTVDGANRWQAFRFITIPMLRPILTTIILLGMIWTFNSFNVIYLVTTGAPSGQTEILATTAYRIGFQGIRNYSASAAYAVIILLILIVFSLFYVRVLSRNQQGGLA